MSKHLWGYSYAISLWNALIDHEQLEGMNFIMFIFFALIPHVVFEIG